MSELVSDARKRKDLLKHMILQLHKGQAPEAVRTQLVRLMGEVPYGDVVEVEQELISEGLPTEEVLKLCDVHTAALQGVIDRSAARTAPPGHPVHTFQQENRALAWEVAALEKLYEEVSAMPVGSDATDSVARIRVRFHTLMDVDKHYVRKENLLFPYLEKHGLTGPPTVMWGKHNETRGFLKKAIESLAAAAKGVNADEARSLVEATLRPASKAVEDMIDKEEQILFPMCLDTLAEAEWHDIYGQSPEIGFCLYDPQVDWKPGGVEAQAADGEGSEAEHAGAQRIRLPTGSFTVSELEAILNTIPFDLTFVDKDDTVRYFTHGRERIFARNRAILGRKVQFCHPPASVNVVERILTDFKLGKHDRAVFWIELKGRFLSIEYFALRGSDGEYLGTLEVSQDLTGKRALEGERRLLAYEDESGKGNG